MKRFFLPPLAPALMVLAMCTWTIWDESCNGPPRMIDGQPDDAPRFAALLLAFFTPVFYVVFGLLNLIDSCADRFRNPLPWLTSGLVTMAIAILLSKVFYVPNVDSSPSTGITMACVIAVVAVWPMCLIRRLALSRSTANRHSLTPRSRH